MIDLDRFDAAVAFLRGRKPMMRDESAEMHADYLDAVVRPLVQQAATGEAVAVPVRRGPGRPRKVETPCV